MFGRSLLTASALIVFSASADAQFLSKPIAGATRTEDVIYGRKNGVALTMDVFEPKAKPNGAGVIICVSAEFRSGKEMLNQIAALTAPQFLDRGYVVFMVTHGSQPVFTVPDIVEQVHRAVRFIKANAKKFNVDPDRLGIAGASSGGQLCLMMGCAGTTGDSKSSDPIEKQSSKVAAVACIFPLSDFLEFDKDNLPPQWERFRALLDVHEFSPMTNRLERVTPAAAHAICPRMLSSLLREEGRRADIHRAWRRRQIDPGAAIANSPPSSRSAARPANTWK